ncbi:hypothetical protein [Williamsia sp. 1135]|uniref:hypothetical protein n=1 Tax=Williamsia sp. 1135 TaxID=1889262 RepID=UPI000A115A68|nr:hypothetical protein [Williamsia sp. 1135]ORM30130.1 hypothetical protein BFL43_18885 [Williamsia sp. 1135]
MSDARDETSVFVKRLSNTGVNVALLAAGVILVLVAVVVGNWIPALIGALLVLTIPLLIWTVRIDSTGVHASSLVRFPSLNVSADEIDSAESFEIASVAKYGGIGLRHRPGSSGLILGTGPALRVVKQNGKDVVISMSNPEQAVGAVPVRG